MLIFILQFRVKSHRCLLLEPLFDDLFQVRKCTAADKEDVLRIYRSQRHHSILAVRSHGHLHLTSFQKLEHPLLNRLSAHIPLVGVPFLRDLVDLIDKDDPLLGALHIVVRSGKEF